MLGKPLINLSEVFANCPLDENDLPKLAVARADRFQVMMQIPNNPKNIQVQFIALGENVETSSQLWSSPTLCKLFSMPQIPEKTEGHFSLDRYSLIPMVPADVRNQPHVSATLNKYHTLWEVDNWSEAHHGLIPDRDPLLLEHLLGDLYVVQAAWELTELERAIMSQS